MVNIIVLGGEHLQFFIVLSTCFFFFFFLLLFGGNREAAPLGIAAAKLSLAIFYEL